MYLKKTCVRRNARVHGVTAACGLKMRGGRTDEASWKSENARNEKNYENLEKTSDQAESDEEDATA